MFQKTAEHLPVEIWDKIAREMSIQDRLGVSASSSFLNNATSSPSLWGDVELNKKKVQEEGIMAIFKTKFRRFKKLNLSYCQKREYAALFEYMASEEVLHIEELDGRMKWAEDQSQLQKIPPMTMGKALARLKKVCLDECFLTVQQWTCFLQEICRSNPTSVEDLDLSGAVGTIRSVPPIIVGKALASVKKLSLQGNILKQDQLEWTLHEMGLKSGVEEIDLSFCDIRHVPARLLGKALKHVKIIRMSETQATEEQWTRIFEATESAEEIDLSRTMLTHVDPEVVGHALASFKRIYLSMAWLTIESWIEVFKSIESAKVTSVEYMDLSNTDFDENGSGPLDYIREVPGELMGRALARVKKVDLQGTKCTDDQYLGVLKAMDGDEACNLIDLSASDDLRHVPAQYCRALAKLKKIDLGGSKLSREQWTTLLNEILATPPGLVEDVILDFSNWDEAPAELLNQVEEHLGIMMY